MFGWLLFTAVAVAQDCGPVSEALADLDGVVSAFFVGGAAADLYCPDDLQEEVDLGAADGIAAKMDAAGRSESSRRLLEAASELGAEDVQAAANAAALMDALLGAGQAAGEDVSEIVTGLLDLAEATGDPLLERQVAMNLWRRGVKEPSAAALIEKFIPTSPDYERIFGDGRTEMHAMFRTGHDGFKHGEIRRAFERQGATVEVIDDNRHWKITYTVKPDDPALPEITWTIDVVNQGYDRESLMEDMDDPETAVTMFADHSQLGTSMDRGIDSGPQADDSTNFFWVDACKSKVFASRLSQAYPAGHFIYTKDSEFFRDMPMSYERGLVALTNHYNYDEMRRLVGAGSAWQPKNYIFPDDPQKFVYQDQDGDGVVDSEDRIYNVPGSDEPSGELATRAVTIANTYMGYSGIYQYYTARGSVLVEDTYRPDGIFDGEPGGPVTRIETRTDAFGEEKHFVAVSDEALSMHQTLRTARVAAEMGVHQGNQREWDAKRVEAASFLLGSAVFDVWNGGSWEEYRDATMPGSELWQYDVTKFLDNHDFVVENSVRDFMLAHPGE